MTTRAERIKKAERAVLDAAKEWYPSDRSAGAVVAAPVARLLEAEASGPPDLDGEYANRSAAVVLRALVDAPGFCVSLALEWADELEER